MPDESVTVVVPVHNGERTIGDCIRSLLDLRPPPSGCEIVVVDNRSRDGTAEVVRRFPVRYLRQPRRGAAAARNMGVQEARGAYVAFTDADCLADRDWLDELRGGFTDESVACVGGAIVSPPAFSALERYMAQANPISQEKTIERDAVPHAITANAMFRRRVFDEVGLFDERFPMAGGEDVDLGWRIHGAGYRMKYVPGARVEHRHKSSARQLFRQHYRYGHAWTILLRKYPHLAGGRPRPLLGLYPDDLGNMRRVLSVLVTAVSRRRGSLESRFAFYDALRWMGQYAGQCAAAVLR
ncbi:MAG: glycosyltransferase [bacterium]|nr:glycosyltransferase [bacterium]